jgi:hypothetical protein
MADRLAKSCVRTGTGCLVWTGMVNAHGYGVVATGVPKPHQMLAHRAAWALAHPLEELPTVVRHSCDNPPCIEPTHLLAGTQADNIADAIARDRMARAERHPGHKLTEADVAAIRDAYAKGGVLHRQLAQQYGVSRPHISAIIRGEERTRG